MSKLFALWSPAETPKATILTKNEKYYEIIPRTMNISQTGYEYKLAFKVAYFKFEFLLVRQSEVGL